MTAWVLILWMASTHGDGMTAVDFADEAQCYAVLRMMKATRSTIDGVCIKRKGVS